MRTRSLILAAAVVLCVGGCDTTGRIAGLNGNNGNNATGSLSVTPPTSSVRVGGTVQLQTNATPDQQTQLQWTSSQPIVAAVSPTGLVTALSAGSATISVRLATDTTVGGSSTITVIP